MAALGMCHSSLVFQNSASKQSLIVLGEKRLSSNSFSRVTCTTGKGASFTGQSSLFIRVSDGKSSGRPLIGDQGVRSILPEGFARGTNLNTGRLNTRPAIQSSQGEAATSDELKPTLNGSLAERIPALVGEDAAVFDSSSQSTTSWVYFTMVLGVVLGILYYIWLDPNTGYGGAFIDAFNGVTDNHELVMVGILLVFAIVHSGGAALRSRAEKVIGERAYRVLFAGLSLPLAVSAVVYFINHRYDGVQLWQLRTVPGVHELAWILSFISFFFLYPSTFNLLEVAAVDKPKVHMWETGIMRITRHPQMAGMVIWALAHAMWIGNSFTLTTCIALSAHHAFGVWHGDQRLSAKYGEAFDAVKDRTSIIPFAAIVEGRQKLPADYYKEFMRVPYYAIVGVTLGAYFSHSLMQNASHWLHW
eukprot:jgi/Mesen1/8300/ME000451S07503